MIRRLAPLALAVALWLATLPSAATEAMLRNRVMVEGEFVTLGDLFDNVGDKASRVVMRAPAPGQCVTVDDDWLTHTAQRNSVAWHPRDLFEEATIERVGVVIGRDQILAALQDALAARGAPADSMIETDNRTQQIVTPVGSSPRLEVRDLFYHQDDQRFSATVTLAEGAPHSGRLQVSGHLVPTVALPTVTRPVGRGEIITAQDIGWTRIRQSDIRAVMLKDFDAVVGMAAKVPLRPNLPISLADLQKPLAVTRGAIVTMVLTQGGMALSAQGRALDQGSLGEVIRITNTHSNLTVEAVIDGTNHARVSVAGPVALAN